MQKASASKMRDRRNTNLSVSSTDSSTPSIPREKRHASPPPAETTTTPATVKRISPAPRRIMLTRLFTVLCGLVLLWQSVSRYWNSGSWSIGSVDYRQNPRNLTASFALPNEPTALIVSDAVGTSKWTISIPHDYAFPLVARHYREMCSHGAMLRNGLAAESKRYHAKHWLHMKDFLMKDYSFLDIAEAEKAGALPATKLDMTDVCESSMTFVFESEEASFGQSLLLLWLSYGLAKKEGRSFFIDDTRWTWGRYESYFKPAPVPKCRRPPPQHLVPCPHSARHLVLSSATAAYQFGPDLQAELQQGHLPMLGRLPQRKLFDLLRSGYEVLFQLAGDDASYVSDRIAKLKGEYEALIGMHIRRGDKHPFEYQYSRDYLPLERFTTKAQSLSQSQESTILLASDDPEIINYPELQQGASPLTVCKAQERIQLATKAALDRASPVHDVRAPGSAYVLHKDENVGWEGGFYSALFHSLGGAKVEGGAQIPEQALRMRELVGRAYLLDIAVLGRSDGIVCGVSSATCRVLAVMMGWDAVKNGRWINVDDGRSWSLDGHR